MNENEIIDVEVNEIIEVNEVIETIPMEDEVLYTDVEIDTMLQDVKDLIITKKDMTAAFEMAQKIAVNSKEYLDCDTYLWVMYTYSLTYKNEDNQNAWRYCCIRMKEVLEASKGNSQKQKALTFVPITLSEAVINNTYEACEFMEVTKKQIRNQFFMMQAGLMAIFLFVIKVILSYSWLYAIGFSGVLFILNVKLTYGSLKGKYVVNQTNACKEYAKNDELIAFDLPVLNS